MKFSLFFEMQVAGARCEDEQAVFLDCVEQAVLADALGYHCAWEVEHHGLYQYSHSSAPEVFLAFLAARTDRIRLGHGCVLLPHRYNHPIRVAERVATLDILSRGRVNLGTARSGSKVEQGAFEVDAATLRDEWLESLTVIPLMWRNEPFSYRGRFLDIPPTMIVPKPVQVPHPPLFAACSKPADAAAAGLLGLGVLSLAMHRDEVLADRIRTYRDAVARASPVGASVTNHFACNAAALVLPNDRTACELGLRGAFYFKEGMAHYYGGDRPVGPIPTSTEPLPESYVSAFRRERHSSVSQLSSVIGDPVAAAEAVHRFREVGVDELILVMQTGMTPHEVVMESIRTFGERVMPHFV